MGTDRRSFLKASLAVGAGSLLTTPSTSAQQSTPAAARKPRVAVIGAGAFGGWSALHLLRQGAQVTLLDAWGPGNARASSGGETRVIRGTYGPEALYTRMTARALELWKENEQRWQRTLYHRTGMMWMAGKYDIYEKAALPHLRAAGLAFDAFAGDEAARRWPQVNFSGVNWVIFEKDAGFLTARLACEAVMRGFVAEGGEFKQLAVAAPGALKGKLSSIALSNGEKLAADIFVFACGPWLGQLFPDLPANTIEPSRQEIYFFGAPAGDFQFDEKHFPAWIHNGPRLYYGIPGNQWRGFKLADDSRGPAFDPTNGDRQPNPAGIAAARQYLAFRFPKLRDAPLLEARVCQYENSPDHNFILDCHPGAGNVWLVGGGSGHGFKHGPAMGEMVANAVLDKAAPEKLFSLARLAAK